MAVENISTVATPVYTLLHSFVKYIRCANIKAGFPLYPKKKFQGLHLQFPSTKTALSQACLHEYVYVHFTILLITKLT